MNDTRKPRFGPSICEAYDRYLGSILFEPYARNLARRIVGRTAGRILEIACGTGILTRSIRADELRLPIVATDLSEPMLAYARTRCADLAGVEWKVADAEALPFPPPDLR